MAKQTGPFLIQCTIDGVCFYIANGEGCVRASSPPEAKRVKKAPAFAEFRRYSDYLKQASPLASAMHKTLPEGRQRHHYQRLAGVAIRAMKAGGDMEMVVRLMEQEAELICNEIREGVVTAVVHGEQAWKVKWKDGEPVLQKRRKKTTILKSAASMQQRQMFEELKEQKVKGAEPEVDSLELEVAGTGVGVGCLELGIEGAEFEVGSLELAVDGIDAGMRSAELGGMLRARRDTDMNEQGKVESWVVECSGFNEYESDLFNFNIEKPLVHLLAERATLRVNNGEQVRKRTRRGRVKGQSFKCWPSG